MTGEKGENCERRKNQAILDSFLYPLLYILEGGLKISQKKLGPFECGKRKRPLFDLATKSFLSVDGIGSRPEWKTV